MIARAIRNSFNDIVPRLAALGFSPHSKVSLSIGTSYSVHAVSVYEGVVFFQIVDDKEFVMWLPAWLFALTEWDVPSDWICNVFAGDPELVMGPDFVASSLAAYSSMVDLLPESEEMFWKRIAIGLRG